MLTADRLAALPDLAQEIIRHDRATGELLLHEAIDLPQWRDRARRRRDLTIAAQNAFRGGRGGK
jgi:hypothetical protein